MRKAPSRVVLVASVLLALLGLFVLNWFVALRLLRIENDQEAFDRIARVMDPVQTPLVFSTAGLASDDSMAREVAASVGLGERARRALPATHPLLVGLDWILAANPYTPTLAELHGGRPPHVSFGYLGSDGAYHQVTVFGGEADTTPSLLTPKVRGNHTGDGDYFVRYVVFLETPAVEGRSSYQELPKIHRVDWSAYEGGSSDSFDQIEFALAAGGLELLLALLILAVLFVQRRLSKRRFPAQDAESKHHLP